MSVKRATERAWWKMKTKQPTDDFQHCSISLPFFNCLLLPLFEGVLAGNHSSTKKFFRQFARLHVGHKVFVKWTATRFFILSEKTKKKGMSYFPRKTDDVDLRCMLVGVQLLASVVLDSAVILLSFGSWALTSRSGALWRVIERHHTWEHQRLVYWSNKADPERRLPLSCGQAIWIHSAQMRA